MKHDNMEIDLSSIGMEKGRQYETVITTENDRGQMNAAPIGVLCSGRDTVLTRIFKGSRTLENMISQKEFTVNITHDPEVFMLSIIGNLPEGYFNEDNTLKCAEAYFKCEVTSISEAVKQSDPIKSKGEAIVMKSKATELVIIEPTKAVNRGFGYVVESLSNLNRFDASTEEQKEEIIKRFREAYRIVRKVGYPADIKSMKILKEELVKKGYEP